ncbi:MAG: hypothetical protein FWE95_08470 [Planctomycetaceae bacterium]|nr:hypothetical protein [Planctomycetaceae bacterium]
MQKNENLQDACYIYSLIYNPDALDELPRSKFIAAMTAEGVPGVGSGYPNDPLYAQPMLHEVFKSDIYKKFYTADELDFEKYKQRNHCPALIQTFESAIWIWDPALLLGSQADMDSIVNAVDKIHNNAAKIKGT